jgi:FkbM family methyltransferase
MTPEAALWLASDCAILRKSTCSVFRLMPRCEAWVAMVRQAQLLLLSSPLVRVYPALRRAWQISRYLLHRPITHGDDFAAFARFPERTGLFLDVGASSGTSAMSFRVFNRQSPILSIEPNAILEPELRVLKRIVPRFDYRIAAAGDGDGTLALYVPVYRGVPLTAYSTADRADLLDARGGLRDWLGDRVLSPRLRIEEVTAPVIRLDELELDPAFVKIDVEGAELQVLRGLADTLRRSRPILLIERSRDFAAIHELLTGEGYQSCTYRRDADTFVPAGVDAPGPNVFFLPPARSK